MQKYDLVVIGSGAGLLVLEEALNLGMKCAIVEKDKFGGTCLTKGCIPSKMLVYPADLLREFEGAVRVGLQFQPPRVDWETISGRMWKQINISKRIEEKLNHVQNLKVYKGIGEFTGSYTMRVKDRTGASLDEFEGARFLISAGARTFVPPIEGLEEAGYIIPETFFGSHFPETPWNSLVIIGGGAISAEFAHIFSSFGTRVTVVEKNPRILPAEEEEISAFVKTQFQNKKIQVFTDSQVLSVGKENGHKVISVKNSVTGNLTEIEGDEIFVASGIRSNADILKLHKTLVKTDSKGWITTNEYLETSQENIWAIGDINGKYQFRHKANYEADILVHNVILNQANKKKADYSTVPWTIFTTPQVAHVGLTERQAKERGLKYRTAKKFYSEVAGGRAMGYEKGDEDNGFVKLIVGEDKKILGVHIVGPHASILLQPFVYLMNAGHRCEKNERQGKPYDEIQGLRIMCPQMGTYVPIHQSMVIHPSLSELTAWVIDKIQ